MGAISSFPMGEYRSKVNNKDTRTLSMDMFLISSFLNLNKYLTLGFCLLKNFYSSVPFLYPLIPSGGIEMEYWNKEG